MKRDLWDRVADFVGLAISPGQAKILHRYRAWLENEAVPAGGLGADEGPRLESRHIADSLLFYVGWRQSRPPSSIWDLGTGVGLPGIPLAIVLPETEVLLFDRSGRRVDLARRAVRVLGLSNVSVERAEVEDLTGQTPMLVARAAMPPARLRPMVGGLLEPGGVAVVGGSWASPPGNSVVGWEIEEIPRDLLDRPVWLLIMRR